MELLGIWSFQAIMSRSILSYASEIPFLMEFCVQTQTRRPDTNTGHKHDVRCRKAHQILARNPIQ
jgi:hypothetical protein